MSLSVSWIFIVRQEGTIETGWIFNVCPDGAMQTGYFRIFFWNVCMIALSALGTCLPLTSSEILPPPCRHDLFSTPGTEVKTRVFFGTGCHPLVNWVYVLCLLSKTGTQHQWNTGQKWQHCNICRMRNDEYLKKDTTSLLLVIKAAFNAGA